MIETKKPWWFPELVDKNYINQLRKEYDIPDSTTDESVHEHYCDSLKYAITWDHTGDAYEEYERLADAYLELLSKKNGELK